jgi:hypothetical protein
VTGPRVRGTGAAGSATLVLLALALSGCHETHPPDPRFELRCDPGCGPDQARLLAEMEAVRDSVRLWFGAASRAGVRAGAPGWMRRGGGVDHVRFHGTVASFERADRRLASGRYREQRAFSHARSRTAHILSELEPQRTLWAERGPGPQGERLAIHEASHLATYRVARDAGWPEWLAEGIAGRLEEGWAERRGDAGDRPAWQDPWLDTRRRARRAVAAGGGLPTTASILRGELEGLPLGTRYAVWAGFVETLLETPFRERTLRFLAELAGPAPRGGWTARAVAGRFERHFDARAAAAIDARFLERVEGEPEGWLEIRRAAGLERYPDGSAGDGPWLVQRPTGENPLLWRPAGAGVGSGAVAPVNAPEPVRVVVEILFADPGAAAVVVALGTTAGEGIGVVVATEGHPRPVRVPLDPDRPPLPFPSTRDAFPSGGEGAGVLPPPGARVGIEVGLSDQVLSLSVGGEAPLQWPAPGLHPDGSWGIGTVGRTVARWRAGGP